MEYIIYRDGERLPISSRGGQFFVDTDVAGDHEYYVTALSLGGDESAQSPIVSTMDAEDGWFGTRVVPNPPSSVE